MLSGARVFEMFDGDVGFALPAANAVGLRQDRSRAVVVRRAPQAVRMTTLDRLRSPRGCVVPGLSRARGDGLGLRCWCLDARSPLAGALREITECRYRRGATVWRTGSRWAIVGRAEGCVLGGETSSRSHLGRAAGFAASVQVPWSGSFLLDEPQMTHLLACAVLRRISRSFSLPAVKSNEAEFTVGPVEARVIAELGIGRSDRGIE